jgi:YD repeat-containing protein
VGASCVDNSWTYNGQAYARDSQTLAGRTTRYTYDAFGNLASVTNGLGQTTAYGGYNNGLATSVNYNNAYTVARTTSWEGWLVSETNGASKTTSYTYDGAGRPTSMVPPGSSYPIAISYSADGSTALLTRGTGVTAQTNAVVLDGFSRPIGTSNSEGVLTSTTYDAFGRTVFKSYKYNATSGAVGDHYEYDGLGRESTLTRSYRPSTGSCDSPGACAVTTSYASNNCTLVTVDRNFNDAVTTTRCFTSFGDPDEHKLAAKTNADGTQWSYAYGVSGQLTSVAAPIPGGNVASTLDPSTQAVTSTSTGPAGTSAYRYDAAGNVLSATDSRGVVVNFSRADPLGRMVGIAYQTGSQDDVTLSYDAENNVTGLSTVNGGAFAYTYDELNRPASQTWSTPAWGGTPRQFVTSYSYDQYGCLSQMTYPTGTSLTMTCDTQNRVTSITAMRFIGNKWVSVLSVGSVLYHPSGKPSSMTLGNGIVGSRTYDGRARTASVSDAGVLGLSYAYDGAGNITSFNNAPVQGSNRTMIYDAMNRLEVSTAPSMWGTAAYSYDALGNRTMSSEGSYTTNFTYDSQTGRLGSQTGGQAHPATASYTWDLAGRLSSTSDGVTYWYDGTGRRVAKVSGGVTVAYHYDNVGRLVAETNGASTVREYFYLGNRLLGTNDCSSGTCAVRYYHTAIDGSVLAITDTNAAIQARLDYYPSGQLWNPPSAPGERQYQGQTFDPGTCSGAGCTLSLGAAGPRRRVVSTRFYSPAIGRYISSRPNGLRVQSLASSLGLHLSGRGQLRIPRSVALSRGAGGIIGRSRAETDPGPYICIVFVGICSAGAGPIGTVACGLLCTGVLRGDIKSPSDPTDVTQPDPENNTPVVTPIAEVLRDADVGQAQINPSDPLSTVTDQSPDEVASDEDQGDLTDGGYSGVAANGAGYSGYMDYDGEPVDSGEGGGGGITDKTR